MIRKKSYSVYMLLPASILMLSMGCAASADLTQDAGIDDTTIVSSE
jgi:hypothetical protein